MERPSPRILIVDDEEPFAQSLCRAAVHGGYRAEQAGDGESAWGLLSERAYDLVATDLCMPGVNGRELLGRINSHRLSTRVVVITGHATLDAAVDCLRKGAADFLVKPFPVEEFLASVRKILGRPAVQGTTAPDWGAVGARASLTPREQETLKMFYATGVTNQELAHRLSVSPHTVKSHLKNAFVKLGVSSRAELLKKLRDME